MGRLYAARGQKPWSSASCLRLERPISQPCGNVDDGAPPGWPHLSEQMPFPPFTEVRSQLTAGDSACSRRLAVGGHAARCYISPLRNPKTKCAATVQN